MHPFVAPMILGPSVLGIGQDIGDVHGTALENGPPRRRPSVLAMGFRFTTSTHSGECPQLTAAR